MLLASESTRRDLIQVHEHCPQRAYVELIVPENAETVTAASFTTISRDQGWADSKVFSYTWFEVGLRRPGGKKSDIGAIRIHRNRVADPEFFEATTHWDRQFPQLRSTMWLQSLRAGDVIQIIPKAVYRGWVNIIREATIKIEYQPYGDGRKTQQYQDTLIPVGYYQPLDYSNLQIRVLVVKPGNWGDRIQAHFDHANLTGPSDQQNPFNALSYCWGDSPEHVDIDFETECENLGSFNISCTVERAIRRLRSKDRPLRIWIDAICINQVDLEERREEVSMMGSIYSHAKVVHIWLDEANPGIEPALRVIRDIHNYHQRICPGGDGCHCHGTRHTLCGEDFEAIAREEGASFAFLNEVFNRHANSPLSPGTYAFDAYAVEAAGGDKNVHILYLMQSLFQHPWFQRVWVVQEATLSQHAVLHYGKEMITWGELLFVNELLTSRHFDGEAPNMRGQLAMPVIWSTLAGAKDQRAAQVPSETTESSTLTILQVFIAALDLKATDPRDKLFALLAFGQETGVTIPPDLRPDYTKPLPHVMADFTRWWIREYHSLDIFSFIHCHPTRAWQRILNDDDPQVETRIPRPTWAIGTDGYSKWSRMTLLEQFPSCRAAANTIPDSDLLQSDPDNPSILRLRGFKLASVVAVAHPPKSMIYPYTRETPSSPPPANLPTVFHHMFDPSGFTGMWSHPGTTKKEDEMGPDMRNSIFTNHVGAHANYFPTTGRYAVQPTGRRDEWYERVPQDGELPTCIDKCFFVASDGSHGLCPWTVREGDVIVVLNGGKIPFMLRPLPGDANVMEYELVAECFVDRAEIMNGTWIEENTENWEPQVFTLV
ncbi:hypothetical protein ONZ43_g2194 [Nemania bipapillata]|uniref:Uncharacterized protein n=1 Tax=Nemania bipapillata TaxID=110536 RepID=A0ACC2J1P9_9PEZI|nr:hypothetical protein ONZ43_g2194 [Nemania bipapillata]